MNKRHSAASHQDLQLSNDPLFVEKVSEEFVQQYNRNSRPFAWTAIADFDLAEAGQTLFTYL